ncbi:MAG: hypothetical protein HUJ53_01605 [Holdemanella sp.]|nr:hypothetical protein [Holdemanella sp.]
MTVAEWIKELKLHEPTNEVVFELDDSDVEIDSYKVTKFGDESVSISSILNETFIGDVRGECLVSLEVKRK